MSKKKIVVFSGAGLDRESGVLTFRDCVDGLWNNHKIEEVATPDGWAKDPAKVLNFYNERRRQMPEVEPNGAHLALAELEEKYEVIHVTQNVSDLLERGGATKVYHLHGELTKVRAAKPRLKSFSEPVGLKDIGYEDVNLGDVSEVNGEQLRPHIVWFEEYPEYTIPSTRAIQQADVVIVVGTSLSIGYTAPMLAEATTSEIYFIDPSPSRLLDSYGLSIKYIMKPAVEGVTEVVKELLTDEVDAN